MTLPKASFRRHYIFLTYSKKKKLFQFDFLVVCKYFEATSVNNFFFLKKKKKPDTNVGNITTMEEYIMESFGW